MVWFPVTLPARVRQNGGRRAAFGGHRRLHSVRAREPADTRKTEAPTWFCHPIDHHREVGHPGGTRHRKRFCGRAGGRAVGEAVRKSRIAIPRSQQRS